MRILTLVLVSVIGFIGVTLVDKAMADGNSNPQPSHESYISNFTDKVFDLQEVSSWVGSDSDTLVKGVRTFEEKAQEMDLTHDELVNLVQHLMTINLLEALPHMEALSTQMGQMQEKVLSGDVSAQERKQFLNTVQKTLDALNMTATIRIMDEAGRESEISLGEVGQDEDLLKAFVQSSGEHETIMIEFRGEHDQMLADILLTPDIDTDVGKIH